MKVNPVSTHNNAHRTTAVRTEESSSRQEQSERISKTKESRDTFERKPFNVNGNTGNGQNVYNGGDLNTDLAKFRAENAREPDKDPSERVYGSGVQQYEKPKPDSEQLQALRERDAKIPVTNSDKLYAEIRALSKEPMSDEKIAKMEDLVGHYATEQLRERGIKVVSDDKYADYLKGISSEPAATDSSTAPTTSQNFTTDAVSFLSDAAAKLLNGGEGFSFSDLGIDSGDFVKNMLEAFSNGEHSSDEIATLTSQSEALIREFAAQISNGQEPDFYSLTTELTINGANTTIGQLLND